MFMKRPARLRYFSMEAGTGEEIPPSDGGTTDALGGTIPQPQNDNPSWNEYLEEFPESVRHIARDAFSKWDKGVQSRFDKIHQEYEPYKQFKDQNIDPKRLESAYGVADMLEKDPVAFTKLLAQQLGLTLTEAQAQAAAEELQEPEGEESLDPRIAALQQSQQQLMDYITNQQQETQRQQLEAQQEQQLTQEFNDLEATHGKMIPEVKNQVLREAARIIAETGQPVTMQQAYASLESFVRQIRSAPRPGQLAPRTMPSGGSLPITPPEKSPGQWSGNETRKYAAEVAARALAQG